MNKHGSHHGISSNGRKAYKSYIVTSVPAMYSQNLKYVMKGFVLDPQK